MSDYTTRPISALPKGVAFAGAALALTITQGNTRQAQGYAEHRWRDSPSTVTYLKSAVASGSTTDSEWASPLAEYDHASAEFSELLRNGSILGKLTGARRVPFGVRYPQQTAASSVAWVGQSAPAPVSELAFQTATMGYSKVSGIVAFTNELGKAQVRTSKVWSKTTCSNRLLNFWTGSSLILASRQSPMYRQHPSRAE